MLATKEEIDMSNTEFIGITSVSGGSGNTSLCICLSRILTSLFGKRVLCLNLDGLSHKMQPKNIEKNYTQKLMTEFYSFDGSWSKDIEACISKDDFSVSYLADKGFLNPVYHWEEYELHCFLDYLSESEMFDVVILDIPFTGYECVKNLVCCEKIIVCKGYTDFQKKQNDLLLEHFYEFVSMCEIPPNIYTFEPLPDLESFSDSNEADMHGQYAAEVRRLASQLIEDFHSEEH